MTSTTDDGDEFVDTNGASAILIELGIPASPPTLITQRVRGGGPEFFKIGRAVRYRKRDLRDHAAEKRGAPVRSTSDYRARQTVTETAAIP